MIFTESTIKGAFLIDPERIEDSRGFFARTMCQQEFENHGITFKQLQCNRSFNIKKGILRGMHYQCAPYEEAKLVWCIKGAIYDVLIDLRPFSQTYTQYAAVILTAENRRMHFIPEGCAHGFQTLEDDTEIFYQISAFYNPQCAKGVRWDDPAFGIQWPADERFISDRDLGYPDFIEPQHLTR